MLMWHRMTKSREWKCEQFRQRYQDILSRTEKEGISLLQLFGVETGSSEQSKKLKRLQSELWSLQRWAEAMQLKIEDIETHDELLAICRKEYHNLILRANQLGFCEMQLLGFSENCEPSKSRQLSQFKELIANVISWIRQQGIESYELETDSERLNKCRKMYDDFIRETHYEGFTEREVHGLDTEKVDSIVKLRTLKCQQRKLQSILSWMENQNVNFDDVSDVLIKEEFDSI